jgi:GNAT superfamily N-acetyltransferase
MITHALESEPKAADIFRLDDLLYAYNVERTGLTDGQRLAIFLRGDGDEVIGGLAGWTWGGTCFIDLLYLPAALRGQGEGRHLMAAAEAEARVRDCDQMLVRTHDFQAPNFYRKLGFVPACDVEYPKGHRNITFMKRLRPSDQLPSPHAVEDHASADDVPGSHVRR